jgi:hypothetical protein
MIPDWDDDPTVEMWLGDVQEAFKRFAPTDSPRDGGTKDTQHKEPANVASAAGSSVVADAALP